MKVDLGKMTEEELLKLTQDGVELLKEEHQWIIFKKLAEDLDVDECMAKLEGMKKGDIDG